MQCRLVYFLMNRFPTPCNNERSRNNLAADFWKTKNSHQFHLNFTASKKKGVLVFYRVRKEKKQSLLNSKELLYSFFIKTILKEHEPAIKGEIKSKLRTRLGWSIVVYASAPALFLACSQFPPKFQAGVNAHMLLERLCIVVQKYLKYFWTTIHKFSNNKWAWNALSLSV